MPSRKSPLIDFGKSALLLAKWLDDGPRLTVIEQTALENLLHVVHFSYGTWRRQQSVVDPEPSQATAEQSDTDT